MKTVKNILEEEKEINYLQSKDVNDSNFIEIDKRFEKLFQNKFYEKTIEWLDKEDILSLSDSYVFDFSQKKELNGYNISFFINDVSIYDKEKKPIGFLKNSAFSIKSKEDLRSLHKKIILNFLIDETNKEVAFLYLRKNKWHVISIKYDNIKFIKGKIRN